MLKSSAVILAGGYSTRLGADKGLLLLSNKPLIRHVLDSVSSIVDEKIVVVSSKKQASDYMNILDGETKICVDQENRQTPLNGALTGFENAQGVYSLLLACDTPFVSRNVLAFLLDLAPKKTAVIPRWPNCQIEPLHAVYHTQLAREAAKNALNNREMNMQAMVNRLRNVRYVSTLVIEQIDPQLVTFFNINTPLDLKKAELIVKRKQQPL
ncbi:MAG: molybdenum cofactor guanylyltransferase [Candidatus Bathyarchaeia archaeon]